jgi:hypothetical protein
MCNAPWYHYAAPAVLCVGVGLTAALILFACALIAPNRRSTVVVVTLVVGSLAAVTMGILADRYAELITALTVGSLVAIYLLKCGWVRASSNGALERTRA